MFEDVLDQAWGNLAGNDLGRVVIHHQVLQDPIKVPLQPWDKLTAGVPLDRPASLNDVEAFEEVLGVRMMVVSARLGNKFITSQS
jgi:hypothetical protein